ncbi:hypothetical protein EK21DRAFT_86098 [Setomelanomma holmii]|uniref:BTB domain-containing protein n=1 Tax=Setomelanomma holmii TaxID=210430 RepID=A0A9P4HFG6_9PLEO|nr:hypothetical protein EK21DRAFT_86098 [Setomelanomma holmii]
MPVPKIKRNAYFQTAILDPNNKTPAPPIRKYRSAAPSRSPTPPTGTLTVTVGQRVWHLPKALVAKHSTYFAQLCQDLSHDQFTLDHIDANDFANLAAYLHSKIYTLNEHVEGYRAIRSNTTAYLLGAHLGAKAYTDAALRTLYRIFEPLARMNGSNARLSSIRASDVEFVCARTTAGNGLRKLFVDAVAARWSELDLVGVGPDADGLAGGVRWRDVLGNYVDLRERLEGSLGMGDSRRGRILKRVEEYVGGEVQSGLKGGGEDLGGMGERSRKVLQPKTRVRSLTRRGERNGKMMGRVRSDGAGEEGIRTWRDGSFGGEESSGVEEVAAGTEDDLMIVDKDE